MFWKDARIQVTFLNLIPMYREYISLINGFMTHSAQLYDNGESSMT